MRVMISKLDQTSIDINGKQIRLAPRMSITAEVKSWTASGHPISAQSDSAGGE